MTQKFTQAQIDFADKIEAEVSPALANWVRFQFDTGRTLDDIEAQLNRAIAVVNNERQSA
jgi:hypothetical protein